jgi:hypothetical protein
MRSAYDIPSLRGDPSATLQKQFVITNCRQLRAIICCGNSGPNLSWGVGGWGH